MTKQEKIIVSAYTGVLMCDFDDVHEYIQKKLGRPVYTHELADKGIQKEVKEKSHEDFLEICNREESEQNWIPCSERLPKEKQSVLVTDGSVIWVCDIISTDEWYKWEDSHGYWLDLNEWIAWMKLPELYKEGDTE